GLRQHLGEQVYWVYGIQCAVLLAAPHGGAHCAYDIRFAHGYSPGFQQMPRFRQKGKGYQKPRVSVTPALAPGAGAPCLYGESIGLRRLCAILCIDHSPIGIEKFWARFEGLLDGWKTGESALVALIAVNHMEVEHQAANAVLLFRV